MTGIGGDVLAMVWDGKTGTVHALDSTGRSSHKATPQEYARRGLQEMPAGGPLTVDVPGVVEGWSQLLDRFGTISLAQALAPATTYARDGFPVQEIIAADWRASAERLTLDPAAARTFLPNGRAPRAGEIFANPRLAATFDLIADGGRDAFYTGPIARAIAADMRSRDGLLDERDLADHRAEWVQPLTTNYRGYELLELPPSRRFVALEMRISRGFISPRSATDQPIICIVAEAKKIALPIARRISPIETQCLHRRWLRSCRNRTRRPGAARSRCGKLADIARVRCRARHHHTAASTFWRSISGIPST
jgi:gamma-glutamyltranspeptidase/glutathione hydrolase